MKGSVRSIITKLSIITIFAVSMGYFEGVVVNYLRLVLNPQNTKVMPVEPLPPYLLRIEQTREVATIIMLMSFAYLIGNFKIEKVLIFLFTFAIWDISYYVSLYILLGWPTSLTTIDVLFLIPSRDFWVAPIYVPIIISSITILVTTILLIKNQKNI